MRAEFVAGSFTLVPSSRVAIVPEFFAISGSSFSPASTPAQAFGPRIFGTESSTQQRYRGACPAVAAGLQRTAGRRRSAGPAHRAIRWRPAGCLPPSVLGDQADTEVPCAVPRGFAGRPVCAPGGRRSVLGGRASSSREMELSVPGSSGPSYGKTPLCKDHRILAAREFPLSWSARVRSSEGTGG